MSIDEAALALDKKRTSMYRVEAGESRVDVHLARSMMDVYDIYAPTLLEDVRYALQPGWWTTFGLKELGYVDVETEAAVVRDAAIAHLPGLLQSRPYMLAVFDADPLRRSRSELATQVEIRQVRQSRLMAEEFPLQLVALIDESVLRRTVQLPDLGIEQLDHLVIMSDLPTVTLRVLPTDGGLHAGMVGAFTLLEFPDPEDQEILYVEYPTGSIHIEDEAEVSRAKALYNSLCDKALSHGESVALIERVLRG